MRLPDGYDPISFGNTEAFARPRASDWAGSLLAVGSTLFGWAESHAEHRLFSGRGAVYACPSPNNSEVWWVVRHYRRGGAIAGILQDRYLGGGLTRPYAELWASETARTRGIATPEILAGAVYREGPFYRADLVTELVVNANDLAGEVFDHGPGPSAVEALEQAGGMMRRLEMARILHTDFNAKNILIERTHGAVTPVVIDLDQAEVIDTEEQFPRGSMRRRLERSLRKFERRKGRALTSEEWRALRTGYAPTS